MKSLALKLSATLLAGALLSACANSDVGEKQAAGGIVGGVLGGIAGAQFGKGSGKTATTIAGALLGAFLGSEAGKSLDAADRMQAQQAAERAYTAPIGQTITWNNPQSGHSGTVTPVRDGTDTSGNYCREFQQTVIIDNQPQKAYGTACRQPDGSWKVVQ